MPATDPDVESDDTPPTTANAPPAAPGASGARLMGIGPTPVARPWGSVKRAVTA
jgi:hypothetical protein